MKRNCPGLVGLLFVIMLLLCGGSAVFAAESESESESESAGAKENAVYNILLVGTDRRDESWNGNSDVIIVATVNSGAEKLCLTSFMRDLYADIPGYGVHKINYAYAVNGVETLKATLLSNYDVEIDNYAIVDFADMAEIVDLVGGVEIKVSDEEVSVLNGYLTSMGVSEYALSSGGTYVLNGYQAVAYMRIRYVGNNDYERTERQRRVLKGIFESVSELETDEMATLAAGLLTLTEHDFSILDMMSLTANLPRYLTYELMEARVPFDGLYYSQNEMLVPDFEATKEKLYEIMIEGMEP